MDYTAAAEQAENFLAEADQFKLGGLVTESPHPVTRNLSDTAQKNTADGLALLFKVDEDVLAAYRQWIQTDAPERIKNAVRDNLLAGGKLFFTGCGSTGRLSILLDSIWRDFWQRHGSAAEREQWEDRTRSIMAGGDFALIKAVEGFEDFVQFGAKQIEDMGLSAGDTVFAITEGGETSFVIGTAWQGLKKGAKVYFVYNNPDSVLCGKIIRSEEVINEPRIEKINLTTGPMAIMGSTRMQATTIQLCVMMTILEMVIRDIKDMDSSCVPAKMLTGLEKILATLSSEDMLGQLAGLVELEESAYRSCHKSTYLADHLGVDVLTDTTERSPTFCTPAFRKWDDTQASESWTYLILPHADAKQAWENMLKHPVNALAWHDEDILKLVGPEQASRQMEIMRQIGRDDVLKFRIGLDGLEHRPITKGDAVIGIVAEERKAALTSPDGFYRVQLEKADANGASTAVIYTGRSETIGEISRFLAEWKVPCKSLLLTVPETGLILDPITRIGIKMLLNALSTCIMVRLNRVLGNCMVALVPSNMKLIDRSTRYIQNLTDLPYEEACNLLFQAIEYVSPRMQAGQQYPPVVALSVFKARNGYTLEEAEQFLHDSCAMVKIDR